MITGSKRPRHCLHWGLGLNKNRKRRRRRRGECEHSALFLSVDSCEWLPHDLVTTPSPLGLTVPSNCEPNSILFSLRFSSTNHFISVMRTVTDTRDRHTPNPGFAISNRFCPAFWGNWTNTPFSLWKQKPVFQSPVAHLKSELTTRHLICLALMPPAFKQSRNSPGGTESGRQYVLKPRSLLSSG